jgi:hypothetical protein
MGCLKEHGVSALARVTLVTAAILLGMHHTKQLEVFMSVCCMSARSLCLHNPSAQCVPIWVSRPDGVKLAHFQTVPEEMTRGEQTPMDEGCETCERECIEVARC